MEKTEKLRVNIGICTYKRQALLEQCLLSLSKVLIPETCHVFLTVIDNDEHASAKACVETVCDQLSFEYAYLVEPKQGIPCARNKAVDVSLERGFDYLIFIDDDETIEPRWLHELMAFSLSTNPDAVIHGQVIPQLPQNTDESIKSLFKVGKRYTGESLTACATDNVLIPMYLFTDLGLRFDESRPLAGGTDTIFFTQASQQGVAIIQCNEAIVYETIPPIRTTLKWLMKRKYRAGLTDAWRKHQKGKSKVRIAISAAVQMLMSCFALSVFALVLNKKKRNRSLLKIAKAYGVFNGVFGAEVDSYK
jgi:succinoglycan biosynthesis protein ExoM